MEFAARWPAERHWSADKDHLVAGFDSRGATVAAWRAGKIDMARRLIAWIDENLARPQGRGNRAT